MLSCCCVHTHWLSSSSPSPTCPTPSPLPPAPPLPLPHLLPATCPHPFPSPTCPHPFPSPLFPPLGLHLSPHLTNFCCSFSSFSSSSRLFMFHSSPPFSLCLSPDLSYSSPFLTPPLSSTLVCGIAGCCCHLSTVMSALRPADPLTSHKPTSCCHLSCAPPLLTAAQGHQGSAAVLWEPEIQL